MSNNHSLIHRILFNPTYAGGLDIQDSLLRLAHVQPGTNKLTTIHDHPLPDGIVENGEIIDEREFARNLADALRGSGIKNGYYVTHTPVQHTALRLLTFPPMPAKELKSAVRYEASRSLPYSLADAAISYSPVQERKPKKAKGKKPRRGKKRQRASGTNLTPEATEAQPPTPEPTKEEKKSVRGKQPGAFLVAATPNAHVLKLMRVAKTAGIRLGVVEPRPLATIRALQHHELINPSEMILDIGEHHSNLTVIINDAVGVARTLPYGAPELAGGHQSDVDRFSRDIIATVEYLTRVSDTLHLQRLVVTGGELHPNITTGLEGLSLEAHTPPELEQIHAAALPAYGFALRGARGV